MTGYPCRAGRAGGSAHTVPPPANSDDGRGFGFLITRVVLVSVIFVGAFTKTVSEKRRCSGDLRQEQELLPPSLREWLPQDHLVWFVLDAVGALDLAAFFAAYRRDGWGRAAHDPAMMVALLVYAYSVGERSSRRIERRCHEDVATRVTRGSGARSHDDRAVSQRHETAL